MSGFDRYKTWNTNRVYKARTEVRFKNHYFNRLKSLRARWFNKEPVTCELCLLCTLACRYSVRLCSDSLSFESLCGLCLSGFNTCNMYKFSSLGGIGFWFCTKSLMGELRRLCATSPSAAVLAGDSCPACSPVWGWNLAGCYMCDLGIWSNCLMWVDWKYQWEILIRSNSR